MAGEQPRTESLDDELGLANSTKKQPQHDSGLRSKVERVHEFQESEGYIIDIKTEDAANTLGLKVAKDRHTVLIPQPSDDSNDPLNWSWAKKHLILFVVSFASFLPDFGSATGAVLLIPQAL
jgi:hypothetical protein